MTDHPLVPLIAMLIDVADSLDAAITVPHSPKQRAMREAMDKPRPGDLVLITFARRRDSFERFGRYLGEEEITISEASEDNDWEATTDTAHVLVLADGRVFHWTNAGCVRVSAIEDAARAMLDAVHEVERAARQGIS